MVDQNQNQNPLRPAAEFLGHIVSASLVLVVLMAVAFLLGKVADMLASHGMDPAFVLIGKALEWLVYVLDAITFAVYVVTQCLAFWVYLVIVCRESLRKYRAP